MIWGISLSRYNYVATLFCGNLLFHLSPLHTHTHTHTHTVGKLMEMHGDGGGATSGTKVDRGFEPPVQEQV